MLCWLQSHVDRWRERLGARQALALMDGHLLADLGLTRPAVTAVLAGASVPMERRPFD